MNKSKFKLDNQEKKIEKALKNGEYVSSSSLKETKKLFKEAAERYESLQKSKRITIRVNQADLIKVKARAKRNNIPYQTLLSTLIRQFAEGKASVQI